MTPRRAALYIDFDNFFGGLLSSDPKAALELVERPSVWLHRLTAGADDDDGRRWLVLRCYMNPAGYIAHPLDPEERLYFSKFRPFFTQAGVEVVDCPCLTRQHKNGADIRIVVDVMSALQSPTHYDEFVLASADADFTPLLQVLRAHDRRATVIATSLTAKAYEALADRYLDEQDLFDLVHPAPGIEVAAPAPAAAVTRTVAPGGRAPTDEEVWNQFCAVVRSDFETSDGPVNLARLASRIHVDLGEVVTRTRWFGHDSFRRAVERVGLPDVEFSQLHFWDAVRHEAPAAPATPLILPPSLPPAVTRFCDLTKMPRLTREQWRAVVRALVEYARREEFSLSEASRWSRDRAVELGEPVSRQAVLYAIRAARDGGADLSDGTAPDASDVAGAVRTSVLRQAAVAGFDASADEQRQLAEWLCDEDSSAEPSA
ncbi:NYN domain-containing protein [Kocuria nitroreducens]|uniref:NYN domain-containing protein n=1 Tax=Kocuria nitroreducens TaxID=3058914 RepID=UPI0036DDF662